MDNKTARQDLETIIRVEDLALGSMRKLRAIQDWLRAEAAPIVWVDPVNLKRTMIAAPGETVEVSAYREGEFTAPLYTHPPAKVPEGFKLMPMHATPEMVKRGKQAHKEEFLYHEDADLNIQSVWKAMAAISPTPATTPEAEWVKLPHDVVINGGMTFRKGVKLSIFIKAAERWHREAMKQYAGISKEKIQAMIHQPPTAQEGE